MFQISPLCGIVNLTFHQLAILLFNDILVRIDHYYKTHHKNMPLICIHFLRNEHFYTCSAEIHKLTWGNDFHVTVTRKKFGVP